ncbi:MAG: hypothetical protein ACOC9Y_01775 [Chloroflexota bacterium]
MTPFKLIAAAVVMIAVGMGTVYAFDQLEDAERASDFAEELSEGENRPVLDVDGHTVTHKDYIHETAAVDYTLKETTADLEAGSTDAALQENHEDWSAVVEDIGVETVALGSLISETAAYKWAIDQGFKPSEEEVAEEVETLKKVSANFEGRDRTVIGTIADQLGEDIYWNEVVYSVTERRMTLSRARLDFMRDVEGSRNASPEAFAAWEEHIVDITESAEVEILDSERIDSEAVDRALEYVVEDYSEFRQ